MLAALLVAHFEWVSTLSNNHNKNNTTYKTCAVYERKVYEGGETYRSHIGPVLRE